ncbi:hypothetical protein H4O14_17280 [Bacillus sp. PAMC26568]|nr:hypothetical protein H4O14_17280 [Bacillus sp. PAMC26568]
MIFTGAAAVFEFVTLPFDGTFSKFITLYLIWLVSSYSVGGFIEEKMKNDEMDTTGSFVLDALIWFNVLNYKFINRFVFRRKNRNSRNAAR